MPPKVLLDLWAWEGLSAHNVQRIAAGFELGGDQHADVQKLAAIGTHGAHENICRRDLQRKLKRRRTLACALKSIDMPFRETFNNVRHAQVKILQPHVVFHAIYGSGVPVFERIFLGGSAGKIQEFWHDMESNPQLEDHPLKDVSK